MDKIEVTVSFLPVINVAGKNRHSVSHETREAIFARIAGTEQFPVREHNVTATVG